MTILTDFRYTSCLSTLIFIFALVNFSCGLPADSLHVMAASSLTEAFEEIAEEFETVHDIKVSLTIAGSASIASQLEDGAKVDVVALADEETMQRVIESRELSQQAPKIFATNYLVLATPLGNPSNIEDLEDLEGSITAICSEQVPCGKLSFQLALQKQIELRPSSFEPNARSVRAKIELGEVDAGLIYVTDVNEQVNYIRIEEAEEIKSNYPIASFDGARVEASDFIDFVLSPTGQKILEKYGFGGPVDY